MVVCNMWLQVHFQCGFIFTEVLCKLDVLSPPRENPFLICKKSQGYHCIKTHFLCWCLGLAFQDPEVTVNSSSLTSKMISLVWFFFSLTQITSTLKNFLCISHLSLPVFWCYKSILQTTFLFCRQALCWDLLVRVLEEHRKEGRSNSFFFCCSILRMVACKSAGRNPGSDHHSGHSPPTSMVNAPTPSPQK